MAMPDSEQARYEAAVVRYVWEAWRDENDHQFDGARVHSIAIVADADGTGIEVRFHIVRQVGHSEHTVRWLVPWPAEQPPDELADDIIYSVWAEANGTA